MAPPTYTDGVTHNTFPQNIATIYNFRPMFSGNINGHGQTIYVVGNSNLYASSDWSTFRSAFGLSASATLSSRVFPQPPSGPSNCNNPGVNNSDAEATLDVEYASAGAPGANIVLAACSDSAGPTSGVLIAVQNLVNGPRSATIIGVSFTSDCEALAGTSFNAAVNTAYQTGVAEGASIYAATGDEGASTCTNEGETLREPASASMPSLRRRITLPSAAPILKVAHLGESSNCWRSQRQCGGLVVGQILPIPEIPYRNNSCGSN